MLIENSEKYGSEGQHSVIRISKSPFIVVDGWGFNWKEVKENPSLENKYKGLDIHLDRDDSLHHFVTQEDFKNFPNKKKLTNYQNLLFTRPMFLRQRRSKDYMSLSEEYNNYYLSTECLFIQKQFDKYGFDDMLFGYDELCYYPDGNKIKGPQLFRKGNFWLRIEL